MYYNWIITRFCLWPFCRWFKAGKPSHWVEAQVPSFGEVEILLAETAKPKGFSLVFASPKVIKSIETLIHVYSICSKYEYGIRWAKATKYVKLEWMSQTPNMIIFLENVYDSIPSILFRWTFPFGQKKKDPLFGALWQMLRWSPRKRKSRPAKMSSDKFKVLVPFEMPPCCIMYLAMFVTFFVFKRPNCPNNWGKLWKPNWKTSMKQWQLSCSFRPPMEDTFKG